MSKNAFQEDAYRPLITVGGLLTETPSGQRLPPGK